MRWQNILIVAKREFLARIKTKGFWIATLLLPLLMGAWVVLPGLLAATTKSSQKLAVVDRTGRVAEKLKEELAERAEQGRGRATFEVEIIPVEGDPEAVKATLDRQVLDEEIGAWLWIDDQGLARDRVEYHAENISNFLTQESLERALSNALREIRLSEAGYDSEQIAELSRSVSLGTVRITEEGSREEVGGGGLALAFGIFLVLYMVLIIYGQQVLQGVLEEKNSRIVEVMLSTVRPAEMMGGKLLGVGCVGLVQLAIWMGTALVLTAPQLIASLAFMPEDVNLPTIPIAVVIHFFFHFLMGYFLFSACYAMIGSAFNDLQEAQQLASVVIIFIILPFIFLMPVVNDPDSTLAVVLSLIPPLTPLMMMLRIAVKIPPGWQLALGYVLGFGFTAFMIWAAARVYRVGILMYGKKPTVPEIWRWARYSGR